MTGKGQEALAALAVIESLHPTARIVVGSQTHGGPLQYADGCGKHGAWCANWARTQAAVNVVRATLAEREPVVVDDATPGQIAADAMVGIANGPVDPETVRELIVHVIETDRAARGGDLR